VTLVLVLTITVMVQTLYPVQCWGQRRPNVEYCYFGTIFLSYFIFAVI
jgi:surface polysaccharide O-acyltransferase-like enzyme